MTTRSIGTEGFRWFIGFVEDVTTDPSRLGQVKVRIPDLHNNMPTEDLPWASMLMPVTSASLAEVGLSPTGIEHGSMVVGFFADGNEGNIPIVMGTINKIPENDISKHDVSRLARETNSIKKKQFGIEPPSAYKAKYPYNKTFTTKSGHAIEIDDTPGQERIHIFHKSGTYTEINKDGRLVAKTVDDDYEIVVKDKKVLIGGNMNVTVNGNVNVKVNGTYTVQSSGNMKFKAPRIDLN